MLSSFKLVAKRCGTHKMVRAVNGRPKARYSFSDDFSYCVTCRFWTKTGRSRNTKNPQNYIVLWVSR